MSKKAKWATLDPWAMEWIARIEADNDNLRLNNEALVLRCERLANKNANLEADKKFHNLF